MQENNSNNTCCELIDLFDELIETRQQFSKTYQVWETSFSRIKSVAEKRENLTFINSRLLFLNSCISSFFFPAAGNTFVLHYSTLLS